MVFPLTRSLVLATGLLCATAVQATELMDYSCSQRNTLAGLQRQIERDLAVGGHVNLRGNCTGALVLRKDVTLSGDGRATLERAQAGTLLEVDHARVTLINLGLSGGDTTVHCRRGASCLLQAVRVIARHTGIRVGEGSHLEMRDSVLVAGDQPGLIATNNANALLLGKVTVSGEHQPVVRLSGAASLDATDASLAITGGVAAESAWLSLMDSTIQGGLRLTGNAQATLGDEVSVDLVECGPHTSVTSPRISCPGSVSN